MLQARNISPWRIEDHPCFRPGCVALDAVPHCLNAVALFFLFAFAGVFFSFPLVYWVEPRFSWSNQEPSGLKVMLATAFIIGLVVPLLMYPPRFRRDEDSERRG